MSQHRNPLRLVLLASACALSWTGCFGLTGEGPSPFRAGDSVSARAASPVPTDVLARAQAGIAAREYWASESERGLQAPNRAHALRTYFGRDGIRVVDRIVEGQPELVRMKLVGLGRGASIRSVSTGEVVARENRVEIARPELGVVEWYENSAAGLEQGFTLAERPAPTGGEASARQSLVLEIAVEGAVVEGAGAAIDLRTNAGRHLRYDKLVVVDAAGTQLAARFEVPSADRIRIRVEDAEATYPVVIDPLLTASFDGEIESNQLNAQLGYSVAGAGDVNGDDYSDVIVGAPAFDGGEVDEGAAFLYLGGPGGGGALAGNPVNAHARLESNQSGVRFGSSVASAGDVNGDGFADVIVGSPSFTADSDSEGAAFVFLGSAAGIADGSPATAHAQLSGDQTDAFVDLEVACAGDLDADGFDDIVLGAPQYPRNGPLGFGGVFVFMGSAAGLSDATVASADATISPGIVAGTSLGSSVASAGDVNGDGFDDLVVGASGASAQQGSAAIFYGSASGLPNALLGGASTLIESGQIGALLGGSVASAGDVNGDGYADVIVGSHQYDAPELNEGVAFVFHGSATGIPSGLASTAQARIESDRVAAALGMSVASAGDVDGDGYGDVVVGSVASYTAPESLGGSALVLRGGPGGIATGSAAENAYAVLEGGQGLSRFGSSVAAAGDVDGDGFGDLLVGASLYDGPQTDEGQAFLYRGGGAGIEAGVTLGTTSTAFFSDQLDAQLGSSVASAGDLNGDGHSDVVIGADRYDNGEPDEGAVFVLLGSPAGIVGFAPGGAHAMLESNQAGAQLGYSVASAGDVNGDGHSDLIVGAPGYGRGEAGEGAAFLFLGSSGGISDGTPASADAWLESNQPFALLGRSVASAGDVNGDGHADVIVGAPNYSNGELGEGAAFVFLGSPAGMADGSPANAHAQLESDQSGAAFGQSAASAGDVNGDGYSDVIVGAYLYGNGESWEGAAFVFHGSSSGLGDGTPASADAQLESNQINAFFGVSVASAGDVNGDGRSDVIVGAGLFDASELEEGAAFVFHGSPTGIGDRTPATADAQLESNQAGAWLGVSVASAGDVNGDGHSDVIVGAHLYDISQANEGAAFVFLGSPAGLGDGTPTSAHAQITADVVGAFFGLRVASAGDVNADGFSDTIVGAPDLVIGASGEGAAFVHLGGNDSGRLIRLRQLRADGSGTSIQPGGLSHDDDAFLVSLTATSPRGRERGKLEVEVCPFDVPFEHPACLVHTSPTWVDLGTTGVTFTETLSGLESDALYDWRARILYAPMASNQPGITPTIEAGPWRRIQASVSPGDVRVPEPGIGIGLVVGIAGVAWAHRRRAGRRSRVVPVGRRSS